MKLERIVADSCGRTEEVRLVPAHACPRWAGLVFLASFLFYPTVMLFLFF